MGEGAPPEKGPPVIPELMPGGFARLKADLSAFTQEGTTVEDIHDALRETGLVPGQTYIVLNVIPDTERPPRALVYLARPGDPKLMSLVERYRDLKDAMEEVPAEDKAHVIEELNYLLETVDPKKNGHA